MSIQICKPKTIDEKCRKCALWADSPWSTSRSIIVYTCEGSHSDECRFLEADKGKMLTEEFFNK